MQTYQSDKRTPTPFNALMIARLKGDGTDRWIRQGEQTGLYIRVRPSGEKYFATRMKLPGGSRIVVSTLGPCDGPGALTLRAAKLAAADKLRGRSISGSDLDVAQAMGQFFTEHVELRWKDTRNASVYRKVIEEKLGKRPLRELDRGDVAAMVRAYRLTKSGDARPVAANRLLSFTKLFLSWCAEAGLIEDNPAAALTTRIAGGDEQSRERVLTDDEIRALWVWNGPHTALLRCLLLTGCRISELRQATAKEIVGERLHIPAGHAKNGKPHWVHVTPTMQAQFTGRAPTLLRYASATAVQACVRRWQSSDKDAKGRRPPETPFGWTPHDLRRTFATIAAKLATPPHIIRALINHVEDGSLAIYSRHDYADERIAATKAIEAHVLGIVT